MRDLDADLSDSQRSELLAFSALAEGKLEAGTVYSTWVEQHSFSNFTQVHTTSHDRVVNRVGASITIRKCAVFSGGS